MAKIVVRTSRDGNVERVALSGAIDEDTALDPVFGPLQGEVVIHLAGIERINSMGVHRWMKPFRQLTQQARVTIEALSYPLVLQANMVANLFEGAKVVSCMAPFYCPSCRDNHTSLVELAALAQTTEAPGAKCPGCGAAMEFDELDNYFNFARPRPAPPSSAT